MLGLSSRLLQRLNKTESGPEALLLPGARRFSGWIVASYVPVGGTRPDRALPLGSTQVTRRRQNFDFIMYRNRMPGSCASRKQDKTKNDLHRQADEVGPYHGSVKEQPRDPGHADD